MWVAITSYVDFLLLTEYRWEPNETIQNLKESELQYFLFEYDSNVMPYSQISDLFLIALIYTI